MRVYVTGTSMVSGLGCGVDEHVAALESGRSSIDRGRHFGPSFPLGWLSRADGFEGHDRLADMSRRALRECIRSAAMTDTERPDYGLALAHSCPDSARVSREEERFRGRGRCRPDALLKIMTGYVASVLAKETGLSGPVAPCSAACAGSGLALHLGLSLIRSGTVSGCFCGGAEIIDVFTRMGFESMKLALAPADGSDNPVVPFGAERSGLVLGEGASFFFIESEASWQSRGAPGEPLCIVDESVFGNVPAAQYGDMPDEGTWIEFFGRLGGKIDPDVVISHGTSTVHGDAVEGRAIAGRFPGIPVIQYKRAFGHCLSASTLLDLSLGIELMNGRTRFAGDVDYGVDPDIAPLNLTREIVAHPDRILKLSAGFGGSVSAISVRRAE